MENRNTEFDGLGGYFRNFLPVPKISVFSVKFRVAISLFLFFPIITFAQEGYEHLSPIAHGAGRTYSATSRGLAAVGLNPSLLGISDDNSTLEIQVFPISAFGFEEPSGFSDLNAFTGLVKRIKNEINQNNGIVSDTTRKHIADLFSNNALSGRADAEILGICYRLPSLGTFTFTWTTHSGVREDMPQSIIDFFKNAETLLISVPNDFENLDLQGMWYNEYSLSFGKSIDLGNSAGNLLSNISIGGAIKYVSGIAYVRINEGNYIRTTPQGGRVVIDMNYDEFSAYNFDLNNVQNYSTLDFITGSSAGSGLGADIGATGGFFPNNHGAPTVRFGMSITDIGSITWNKNATERIGDHLSDTINYGTAQRIQDVTDSLKRLSGTLKNLSSFTTSLPTMFRAGVQIDLDAMGIEWGAFVPKIAAEYANGLTTLVGSLKTSRLGAGLTLERKGNIDLRFEGGFVIESGASDITLGFGATFFKFLNVDLASARVLQFFQSTNSRTDLALAVRAAF